MENEAESKKGADASGGEESGGSSRYGDPIGWGYLDQLRLPLRLLAEGRFETLLLDTFRLRDLGGQLLVTRDRGNGRGGRSDW